jgi:hypothetical protein
MAQEPPVAVLPAGPFDYHNPGLAWKAARFGSKEFVKAEIPFDRVSDFLDGEGRRGHCKFYKKGSIKNEDAQSGDKV